VVTGGWSDKAKEAAAANALLDQGVDVVAMHVDSPATIIQTAEARGAMSIGYQSVEAQALAPKGWITGLGFTWARYFGEVAKDVMAGMFSNAPTYRGLGHMVAVAPFGPAVPEDVRKQVTEVVEKVKAGWNPFTGPITDNEGKVQIPAGQSWGGDRMGKFDWYVEGVVGKVK
jgi:basic membrane lipoprotein Med (substrate-binding protein (PBP1-ABC) superfamily)